MTLEQNIAVGNLYNTLCRLELAVEEEPDDHGDSWYCCDWCHGGWSEDEEE